MEKIKKDTANNCLVSVVVPCYNSEDTVEKTLEALSNQKCWFTYEVIVVNSSCDLTPTVIREKFAWIRLIQLEEKTPVGLARNIGANMSSCEYIAFLDSDCVVGYNWLDSLISTYSDEYCAVGGPVENANPDKIISLAGYILEFSEYLVRHDPCILDHIPSGNILLRKSTFDLSGGYPKDYLYAQEDRLFSWRLRQKTGKKFLFHPSIIVKHNHRITLKDYLRHQMNIGCGGAAILKFTDLRGSGLIKRKWLVNILFPVFPFIKLTRSIYRTLRWKAGLIIMHPHIIPLLFLGMFFWMLGFAKQVNQK